MLAVQEIHLSIEFMTTMVQLHHSLLLKDGMIMSKPVMNLDMKELVKDLL